MNNYKYLVLLLVLICFVFVESKGQPCTTAPVESTYNCSGGNGMSSNGQTINNGETYWFMGTATYSNQVIIEKGGTFIVCGDLTLNGGINIKGDAGGKGFLIIKSGGSLTINSATSLDGVLYNYGDMVVNNNFTINAGGAQFINASLTSTYTITGQFTVNGFTNFSNFGTATLNEVRSNGNSTVCLGAGSQLNLTGTLANDGANSWSAPSGAACVGYTSSSNSALNQPLTLDSDLFLCEATGAGVISNEGNATRNTGCSDCNSILPVTYSSVSAYFVNEESIKLSWETASELNNDYFQVEISEDVREFEDYLRVEGAGTSNYANSYSLLLDADDMTFPLYLRLKQVDYSGESSTSHILVINNSEKIEENELELFPNPSKKDGFILVSVSSLEKEFSMHIYSATGTKISSQDFMEEEDVYGTKQFLLPTPDEEGSYFLKAVFPDHVIMKYFLVE